MKQLVLLFLILFGYAGASYGQACVPTTEGIPDTAFGVYPLPYIEGEREDGGIPDTVCLNRAFDFTFTIKVGDTITVSGFTAPVESVSFAPNDAIEIVPVTMGAASITSSFQYECDPPNCIFTAVDTFGCVKLSGTVASPDQIGQHDITIKGKVKVKTILGVFEVDVDFPNQEIDILRGNYYLFVQEENSAYCSGVSNTYARYAPDIELTNRPNPFSDFTQIHLKSKEEGRFELRVVDMLGQTVRRRPVELHFGENIIDFDGRELADGLYVYTITDGRGGVSGRMVVNHGR